MWGLRQKAFIDSKTLVFAAQNSRRAEAALICLSKRATLLWSQLESRKKKQIKAKHLNWDMCTAHIANFTVPKRETESSKKMLSSFINRSSALCVFTRQVMMQ